MTAKNKERVTNWGSVELLEKQAGLPDFFMRMLGGLGRGAGQLASGAAKTTLGAAKFAVPVGLGAGGMWAYNHFFGGGNNQQGMMMMNPQMMGMPMGGAPQGDVWSRMGAYANTPPGEVNGAVIQNGYGAAPTGYHKVQETDVSSPSTPTNTSTTTTPTSTSTTTTPAASNAQAGGQPLKRSVTASVPTAGGVAAGAAANSATTPQQQPTQEERQKAVNANAKWLYTPEGNKIYLNRSQTADYDKQYSEMFNSAAYKNADDAGKKQMFKDFYNKFSANAAKQQEDPNYMKENLEKDEKWRDSDSKSIAQVVNGKNVYMTNGEAEEWKKRSLEVTGSQEYKNADERTRGKMWQDARNKYVAGLQRVQDIAKNSQQGGGQTPTQTTTPQQPKQPTQTAGGYIQNDPTKTGLSDDDARFVNGLTAKDIQGLHRTDSGSWDFGDGNIVGKDTPMAKAIEARAKQLGTQTMGDSQKFVSGLSDQDFSRIKMTGKGTVEIPEDMIKNDPNLAQYAGKGTALGKAVLQRRRQMAQQSQPAVQAPHVGVAQG